MNKKINALIDDLLRCATREENALLSENARAYAKATKETWESRRRLEAEIENAIEYAKPKEIKS